MYGAMTCFLMTREEAIVNSEPVSRVPSRWTESALPLRRFCLYKGCLYQVVKAWVHHCDTIIAIPLYWHVQLCTYI